jgi:CheY-like chemotaxis protein
VICAYDGQEGLEKLEANPEIDIVLMDIMMPNMNGYEAIQLIRKNPLWQKLPVIGVTAKAMAGDREKCMEAGASDYLTKPIITEQLISLMRVWLYK